MTRVETGVQHLRCAPRVMCFRMARRPTGLRYCMNALALQKVAGH